DVGLLDRVKANHFFNRRFPLIALVIVALGAQTSCRREPAEQKALRHQVGLALRRQNYEKAATLARQAIDLAPHNEGNWERLVQAYFGLADLAGVRRALASWRVAVEKPSPKVDNYAGDLALASGDPAA